MHERDNLPVFAEINRVVAHSAHGPMEEDGIPENMSGYPWGFAACALGRPVVPQYRDLENKREIFIKSSAAFADVFKEIARLPGVKTGEIKPCGLYVVHGNVGTTDDLLKIVCALGDEEKIRPLEAAMYERFEKQQWPEQKETIQYHAAVIDPGAIKFSSNGGGLDNVVVIKTQSLSLLKALDNAGLWVCEPSPITKLKDLKAAYPPAKLAL